VVSNKNIEIIYVNVFLLLCESYIYIYSYIIVYKLAKVRDKDLKEEFIFDLQKFYIIIITRVRYMDSYN